MMIAPTGPTLPAAGVMAAMGKQVTVLATQPRVMEAAATPEVSAFFAAQHQQRGIDIRTGCTVTGIDTENGAVCAVLTARGERSTLVGAAQRHQGQRRGHLAGHDRDPQRGMLDPWP